MQLCCSDRRHSCLEQEVCQPEQQWAQPWPAPPHTFSWLCVCLCMCAHVRVCVGEINKESTSVYHHDNMLQVVFVCVSRSTRPLLLFTLLCFLPDSATLWSFSLVTSSEYSAPLNQSSGKCPTYFSFFPSSASTQQHTQTLLAVLTELHHYHTLSLSSSYWPLISFFLPPPPRLHPTLSLHLDWTGFNSVLKAPVHCKKCHFRW